MKKISTCLLALLLLVASISVTQAAGLNELTETKVQLEDSLDADGFAAAYNKISAYPIAGDLTKRVQGNYISYFAGIDAGTVMILNARPAASRTSSSRITVPSMRRSRRSCASSLTAR